MSGPPGPAELWSRFRRSDIGQKVAETFLTRIVVVFVTALTTVAIARILGPEGKGLYAVAASVGAIGAQFSNLGFAVSNTYHVAKDRSRLGGLVGNSVVLALVLGSVCAGLFYGVITVWPHLTPIPRSLLLLALAWIPIRLAYLLLEGLLLGIQRIRAMNQAELLNRFLALGLIGALFLFGFDSANEIFAMTLVALVVAVAVMLRVLTGSAANSVALSSSLVRQNMGYGLKAYASGFLGFMVLKMDILMVNAIRGSESAGLYSVAVDLAGLVYLYPLTVGNILFPRLCEMGDWDAKLRLVRKVNLTTLAVMLPLVGIAVLLAPTAISMVFGEDFTGSALPFMFLMPGTLIWSIENLPRRMLNTDGFKIEVVFAWLVVFLTNITLNLVLIPRLGMKGAAIASSLSLALLAVITTILVRREKKVRLA